MIAHERKRRRRRPKNVRNERIKVSNCPNGLKQYLHYS
jgi:hypothetical protein